MCGYKNHLHNEKLDFFQFFLSFWSLYFKSFYAGAIKINFTRNASYGPLDC